MLFDEIEKDSLIFRILIIIRKISISGAHEVTVTETNCGVMSIGEKDVDVKVSGRDYCYIKHLMQRGTTVCQSFHRIIRTTKVSLWLEFHYPYLTK